MANNDRDDRSKSSSAGTHSLVRNFADRALDDILEVRKEIKEHRSEMLERERRMEAREHEREIERKSKDNEHDREILALKALFQSSGEAHRKELSAIKEKHATEMADIKKELAVTKTKAGGLGGHTGLGGGGLGAILMQLLGGG